MKKTAWQDNTSGGGVPQSAPYIFSSVLLLVSGGSDDEEERRGERREGRRWTLRWLVVETGGWVEGEVDGRKWMRMRKSMRRNRMREEKEEV